MSGCCSSASSSDSLHVCMYVCIDMVVVGKKTTIALGIHRFTLSATTHVKEIGRGRPNKNLQLSSYMPVVLMVVVTVVAVLWQ